MRHNVSQTLVVIAFNPDNFQTAFWIRKLANESEKFQCSLVSRGNSGLRRYRPAESAAETIFPSARKWPRAHGWYRRQVDIRKDQRIVDGRIHTFICIAPMLRLDEILVTIG